MREEQAGFREGRSYSEQILALRNIIEQSVQFQKNLTINFIDFNKAFDSVHRPSVWKIVEYYAVPMKFINIMKALYDRPTCSIKTSTGTTEPIKIMSGAK